jgi:bacterioferritin-associated ferredoxin
MYICLCNAVTEREIRQAVTLGATTLHELQEGLGVASNCGKCHGCACEILQDALGNGSCCGATMACGA